MPPFFYYVQKKMSYAAGFKKGLLGIVTVLTFPISVPAMMLYESYKEKHKDDVKTDMNYDNIED